jgi:hypothetical protein
VAVVLHEEPLVATATEELAAVAVAIAPLQ